MIGPAGQAAPVAPAVLFDRNVIGLALASAIVIGELELVYSTSSEVDR
jgi:hypothetical protein